MNLKQLTGLFRKLGAPDPEAWAKSQVDEGVDQLARFVFLRQAWKAVVPAGDTSWMERAMAAARARPSGPGAGLGPALERLLAAGGSREDVNEVVRVMQYEVLFSLCYLLEDPGELEPELGGLSWRLMRTDGDGEPISPIAGLHESLLATEPEGRELRPPKPG